MNTSGKCPQCGAEAQGEEWTSGICPACLLKLGLSGAISTSPLPDVEPPPEARANRVRSWRPQWGRFKVAAAAVLAVLATLLAWSTLWPSREDPASVLQFTIPIAGAAGDLALSPDGRALAYTGTDDSGETMLWLRRLATPDAQVVPGTEGAAMPFWSPDSRHIGFFADGKLMETGIEGGPRITLAEAAEARGGSWSHDGTILFAGIDGGLLRVSGSGGLPQLVIRGGGSSDLITYSWPQVLPDGRHFLVYAEGPAGGGISVGALDSGETRKLVDQSGPGLFANGYVVFSRRGMLLVQPFDWTRLEFTGEPVRIRTDSSSSRGRRGPAFSVVQGVLAYHTTTQDGPARLVWLDRTGKFTENGDEVVQPGDFALSPDGTSVALVRPSQEDGDDDLWLLNLRRNTVSRLTYDGLGVRSPVWSPDGNQITFYTPAGPKTGIRQLKANGSDQAETLLMAPEPTILDAWSPDGKILLYTALERRGKRAVWMISADRDRKPQPVLRGEFNYGQAELSPDGRWISYVSDESGSDEVYVRAFPPSGEKWIVSAGGGSQPSWRSDGREIFFLSPKEMLMSVPTSAHGGMEFGTAAALFHLPRGATYQTAPDGRFLVAVPIEDEQPSPIHVIVNWASELKTLRE